MSRSKVEQVLTRDLGIREGMGPDGKKWGITKDSYGWGLFRIGLVREDKRDSQGNPLVDPNTYPPGLDSYYTSQHKANDALQAYLSTFWDKNDKAVERKEALV